MDNLRLYDVLTRHQIYIEGVKNWQSKEFNAVLRELEKEVSRLLNGLRYETLGQMTKKELAKLLKSLKSSQRRIYSAYTTKLINDLKQFMYVDIETSKRIFTSVKSGDKKVLNERQSDVVLQEAEKDGLNVLPLSYFLSTANGGVHSRLWSSISNAPIPANGILLIPFITGFVNSAMQAIENEIRKGYVNKYSVLEVLRRIIGTKSKRFKDGSFSKLYRQNSAVTATAIQHISSIIQASIASFFHAEYWWISVIDNRTTDICERRHKRRYKYGLGPLPPAHIRCRAKTIPYQSVNLPDKVSYYAWMKRQPDAFKKDVLGDRKTALLNNGSLKSKNMQKFDEPIVLSPYKLVSKLRTILTS